MTDPLWMALIVGNTRLHWACFAGDVLQGVWHTRHLRAAEVHRFRVEGFAPTTWASLGLDAPAIAESWAASPASVIALYVASVIPAQTQLWQGYAGLHEICLATVPLAGLYPTLGIDRALNLLGAGTQYGWPVLVVDAGTALTFTAGDGGRLMGGAILPGLTTQLKALGQHTATLPELAIAATLPPRWAKDTPSAIHSGVLYGLVATVWDFVADWRTKFPAGHVVLTGGDGEILQRCLDERAALISLDPVLTFRGVQRYRQITAAGG